MKNNNNKGKMIEIKVKERTMVKPAEKTPRRSLWMSGLDLMNSEAHVPFVYMYRPNGASNFFDPAILKDALSKVLVTFYPMAGRFRLGGVDGGRSRLEIDCNDEGVLFVEAESSSVVSDLGHFAPTPELERLIPLVDYSGGISSYPFLLLQVTYFKCGGVSLGVAVAHRVIDGPAAFDFVNAWSKIARVVDPITIPVPFLDRTILCPRNPPPVIFNHIEYQLTPAMKLASQQYNKSQYGTATNTKFAVFQMTRDQLNILKAKANEYGNTIKYSTYEILAGHIWKCACKARALADNQETRLYFPTNGRYLRMKPPLPPGYFGAVIFTAMSIAVVNDIQSKPLWHAASRIRETLMRMDNHYLRSVIDYLELHPSTQRHGPHFHKSPNFGIVSWMKMPIHDADFGWGRPIYTGPAGNIDDGKSYIIPSANEDGSLLVVIALKSEDMKVFEIFFNQYSNEAGRVGNSLRANL